MQNAVVVAAFALFVVARFLIRELRERRYAVNRIYVLPGILGAVAIAFAAIAFADEPQARAMLIAGCVLAVPLGAAIGYGVAHFTTVRVTDDANALFSRGSYATVAIWLAALGLRLLARLAVPGGISAHPSHDAVALNAALLLLLASALFFVRRRLLVAAARERALGIATALPAV